MSAEHSPQPSQRLKDAITHARRNDPEFAAKVERLAEQDFNPLAVIQRGVSGYDEVEALNADLVYVMGQRNEARANASMLAIALDGLVHHVEAGTVEPSLLDTAKSVLRIYREARDAEQ